MGFDLHQWSECTSGFSEACSQVVDLWHAAENAQVEQALNTNKFISKITALLV